MFKNREETISNCEKNFINKCLNEYNRLDGRAFDEFRNLQIDFGKDWGCCQVSLGKTRVLAQVSCEIQQPKSSRPSEGVLYINLELNPIASPRFEAGRQSDLSIQLNRLLEKCIKDSKAMDLESLCIKTNEKVWAFRVDLNVLNHDGNIIDCASVACLCALAHFRRPDVTFDGDDFVIHNYKERDPIPTVIHHYPICVTYAIFRNGEYVLADSTLLEENVADANLSVGLNAYKELCGLHLGGSAELTPDLILQTTSKAANRATIVVEMIKSALEKDKTEREKREPVGFHMLQFDEDYDLAGSDLVKCLDGWMTTNKVKKKKWKKTEEAKKETEAEAIVEPLGKGSAVLIPKNTGSTCDVWDISSNNESESDEDVVIISSTLENDTKGNEIMVVDSGSEEENVVVLNADRKTNKKKR